MTKMLFALALFAAPAAAQPALPSPPEPDLLCLAGMAALAASEESEVRDAGAFGTIYFMGKLLGANPDFELETALAGFDYARVTPTIQRACLDQVRIVAERMGAFGGGEAR